MNVLLFGDYSGFQSTLRDGLNELGHHPTLVSSGDGWKRITGADINLGKSAISNVFSLLKNYKRMSGYDVVQFLSPILFNKPRMGVSFSKHILNSIRLSNDKCYMALSGCSSIKWENIDKFRYHPYDDYKKFDLNGKKPWWEKNKFANWDKSFVRSMDGLIPVCYEYTVGYENEENIRKVIPLPINTSYINYNDNSVKNKLILFHGISRYGFKGTRHIEMAFDYFNNKYPNDIECIIMGRMPIDDYLSLMRKTNVVIDQVYSYSIAMNALYAMAMGKVVLGGAEPESLAVSNINRTPVINIVPSYKDIVSKIEWLLENRSIIEEIGFESRQYVCRYHNYVDIAKKYVDEWAI